MPALALTFDDGPDPRWTPRLLDVLARTEARATFFPIAPRLAARPALAARILAEGHEIGLHCFEHVRHTERDVAWLRADTERALDALAGVGVTPRLWRVPWGALAPWTADVADEHGLRLVGWTADTRDWAGGSAEDLLAAVAPDLREDAIVLAHDGLGPGARRADCRTTVRFVELLAARGHRLGALPRAAAPGPGA